MWEATHANVDDHNEGLQGTLRRIPNFQHALLTTGRTLMARATAVGTACGRVAKADGQELKVHFGGFPTFSIVCPHTVQPFPYRVRTILKDLRPVASWLVACSAYSHIVHK